MKITVAICTWNRADLLNETLSQLSKCHQPRKDWELVIVNNNCSDHTSDVVKSYQTTLPLQEIVERQQGLSHARNAAVARARGDFIVWTDDDVLVNENWLYAYEEAFEFYETASVFGGPVLPWFEGQPQNWITDNVDLLFGAFAVRDLGTKPIPLNQHGNIPFGANYAIRRETQTRFSYSPALGRVGNGGVLGEETEVIRNVLLTGGTGWWLPEASVRHWVPKSRQQIDYISEYYEMVGQSYVAEATGVHTDRLIFGLPRWLIREWLEAELRFRILSVRGINRASLTALLRARRASGHIRALRRLNVARTAAASSE